MTFSVSIVVIASTFPHSSLTRIHHSLRALPRPALPLQVRASKPEKILNIYRNKKILVYKELFVD